MGNETNPKKNENLRLRHNFGADQLRRMSLGYKPRAVPADLGSFFLVHPGLRPGLSCVVPPALLKNRRASASEAESRVESSNWRPLSFSAQLRTSRVLGRRVCGLPRPKAPTDRR